MLQAAIPGSDWWFAAPEDKTWTNKSFQELQSIAAKGDAAGQYYLGRAYFFGQGQPRNAIEAFHWVHRAADQGYAQAQLLTSRFFYAGLGTNRNEGQGFAWAVRGAAQTNADALALLGLAYAGGEGTPRDALKARESFERAVAAGSKIAGKWLADFYIKGEAQTARRTNYAAALYWYECAASNGIASAGYQAAEMYQQGLGTPPDDERAIAWVRRMADQEGAPYILEKLAEFYSNGLAEPRHADETPIVLLRRAAARRAAMFYKTDELSRLECWALIHSCQNVWNRCRFGVGTSRDYIAAAQWMWQAWRVEARYSAGGTRSLLGVTECPFNAILKGEVLPLTSDERLWQEAVRLTYQALEQQSAEALHRIAEHYRDGSVLSPQEPARSWAWFHRAAELGYEPAKEDLQKLENTLVAHELAKAKTYWIPPRRSGQFEP